MKKKLPWWVLIGLAILIMVFRSYVTGVIPDAMGLLEALLFILGIVEAMVAIAKRNKTDKK